MKKNLKNKLIGLLISIVSSIGFFIGSYEMAMSSSEYPGGSGMEAFFGFASFFMFILSIASVIIVAVIIFCILGTE